jgi:hypothetical protein
MAHRWWNRTDWYSSKWEAAVAEVSHAPDWRGAQSGESDWSDWGGSGHWLPQNTWNTVAHAAVAGPSHTPSVPEALCSIAEVESPLVDLFNALSFAEHHIHEPSHASYYANDKTCRGATAVAGPAVCPSSSFSGNDAIAPMPMRGCLVNDAASLTDASFRLIIPDLGCSFKKAGGMFNLYGSEGPLQERLFVVMLLSDPALFQQHLIREGCSEATLERADRLVDIYRKLICAPPQAPWKTLDDLWDLEVEIDHADGTDDLPTAFSEELLQAVMQVLFDELHRRFSVEVPVSQIFRQSLDNLQLPAPTGN